MTDRDVNYMKEMWGTTSLITDYGSDQPKNKKMLQEIVHDDLIEKPENSEKELYERKDDSWNYGIEPTYVIK